MTDTNGDKTSFAIAGARIVAEPAAAGLHVVATPIGNLADITLRALFVLAGTDRILCEDTRVTAKLLQRYAIRTPMGMYHDHNAAKVRPRILAELADGARLALVSDAGTPLISDPGFKLVREAVKAGIKVHMAPGVSAPLMALVLSGLPSDRFMFTGFVPQGTGRRAQFFEELASVDASLVMFETAARLERSLAAIVAILGDREIAIARELTKLHEEVLRGRASELVATLAARPPLKGEITLVVAPPAAASVALAEDVDRALGEALTALPAGRAAAAIARRFGLPRNDIYRRALALKGTADEGEADATE